MLRLPAMEVNENSLAAAVELLGPSPEPHKLRTLDILQVLLSPGRRDLFEKVAELVGTIFPRAKCPFRVSHRGCDAENDPEDDEWAYAYTPKQRFLARKRGLELAFWP